jgi:hypothetical protein
MPLAFIVTVQIAALVAWYVWPPAMVLSAWIIFIPSLFAAAVSVIWVLIMLLIMWFALKFQR